MKKLILGLSMLSGISMLTGCEGSDELLRKNLGTFEGKASDGRKCEVRFSKPPIPGFIGTTALRLSIKIWPGSDDGIVSTKALEYNFVQPGSAIGSINRFKIVQGDFSDPRLVQFAETIQISFSNKLATSVQLNSGEECLNLVKRK